MLSDLPSFASLNFGRRDAHDEAVNDPALLLDGFYDYKDAATLLQGRRIFLLLGPKGAGKSAAFEHLRLLWEPDSHRFFELWDLRSFPVGEVRNVKSGANPGLARTQSSWEFLLLLRLLDALQSDPTYQEPKRLGQLRSSLIKAGLLAGDWKSMVTTLSKTTAKLALPAGLELGGEWESKRVDLLQLTEILRRELRSASIVSDHIIALDGLDSLIFEGENHWESLSGLVQALESLNRHFASNAQPVSLIAALRSDLYNILPSAESNKYKALAVEFHWAAGGAAGSPLWDLVDGKVRVGAPNVVSVVLEYLNKTVPLGQGVPSSEFILDHTRFLPRDLIEVLKAIASKVDRPGAVAGQAVLDGVKLYCDEYFEGEVFNNLHGVLARDEKGPRKTAAFRDALRTMPSRFFTYGEMAKEVEGAITDEELTNLLRQMFEVGALGIYNNTGTSAHTDFMYRKPGGSGFTKRYEFVMHNALAKAYNRPTKRPAAAVPTGGRPAQRRRAQPPVAPPAGRPRPGDSTVPPASGEAPRRHRTRGGDGGGAQSGLQ